MPWRGCGRTSGSGPTWAIRRRRWPPPSGRWRPCPGCACAGVSRLYATEPVGVTDQPEFRNAVVALDVPAGPDPATGASALLVALKGLERAFGRQERERWGPREVDLDLLVFGRHRVNVERPPAGRSDDPAKALARWSCRMSRPSTGCSCSRHCPTLLPGSCRRAGARRWPRPPHAAARGGRDAARPIATWDGVGGRLWAPPADSPGSQIGLGHGAHRRNRRIHRPSPRARRRTDSLQGEGSQRRPGPPGRPDQLQPDGRRPVGERWRPVSLARGV